MQRSTKTLTKKLTKIFTLTIAAGLIAGCGQDDDSAAASLKPVELSTDAPLVSFTPDNDIVGKPSGPISVGYRIIGQPIVGQPVAIEIKITSSLGNQPVKVAYRINDATAMRLGDSQPASLSVAAAADDAPRTQQVTIVPLREGRLYLNVAANVESAQGSLGTVTAIPIQVGDAPRRIEENGTAGNDANGDAIRSLPATES